MGHLAMGACVVLCPHLVGAIRADRILLGQGIGVFRLPSFLFRSAQIPLSLYFRSLSQHVYRAPRQCVVCERHAAYVSL
jgi:hypothetical protein